MKVQLAGREVWIEFEYRPGVLSGYKGRATTTEITLCLLRDGSAPREKNKEAPILASGRVTRYRLDPPNRDLARKAALTKALAHLDIELPLPTLIHGIAKERRKLFWDAYLNRKKASPVQSRVLPASSNQPA